MAAAMEPSDVTVRRTPAAEEPSSERLLGILLLGLRGQASARTLHRAPRP
jgi:hypothetical protein